MRETSEINNKVVLIEKKPFLVAFFVRESNTYSGEALVRPCVNEDDLKEARREYSFFEMYSKKSYISYNPSEYYLVLNLLESGAFFVGNIVSKKICKRIKRMK